MSLARPWSAHRHGAPAGPAPARGTRRVLTAAAVSVAALTGLVASPVAATAATVPAAAPVTSAADDDLASRFTLAVIPDTQFYSRYANVFDGTYGTNPYAVQTEWLVEHKDELNIPFATHLGDVVDQVGQASQWQVADRAMKTLEDGGLPYSILPGNHDVRSSGDNVVDTSYNLANEPFAQWFPPSRAAQQATYQGSDPTGLSQYHIFEAEGHQFLVLALTWRASDQTIAWANQVIADHPTLPVIFTTHQLIDIASDGMSPLETAYGLKLWDELIAPNDQIFLTLNGHFHGAAKQTKLNDFGHPVTQVVIDWQMAYEGGNGYLGLYEFDLTHDRINTQTTSPWVKFKPSDGLTYNDQLFQENENQQFSIDIDFADRFGGFHPGWDAETAAPSQPSLYQRAKDILLDGFVAPPALPGGAPQSTEDYPQVDGTVAHWRFNGLPEGTLPENAVVPDVTEQGNDMRRVTIAESGSPTAQVEDVRITHTDVPPTSSDASAVCFDSSDKIANRYSYLTTGPDAPANGETFPAGYTIETYMKISDEWTEDKNAWMKGLVHTGQRNLIPGYPSNADGQTSGTQSLGLSNLREFQWTEVGSDPTRGDKVNWSGEIPLDHWVHVAMVNDPATQRTILYVDGAPTLRIAENTVGSSISSVMPWIIGAAWSNGSGNNSWAGCIGETRLIDHPTTADQWLSTRVVPTVTLSASTLTGAPYQDVTLSAQISTPVSGELSFYDGSVLLGTVPVVDGAAADLTTNLLGTGEHVLTAVLRDAQGATLATSEALVASYGEGAGVQRSTVVVGIPRGAISITTPYSPENPLDLGAATLDPASQTFSASAPLEDIVITDSRTGNLGFTASVVAGTFTSATAQFGGEHAGLTGLVAQQVAGNGLDAAQVVLTDRAPFTDGLGTPKVFATYGAGQPTGSVHIDGVLGIGGVPSSVQPGTYTATVTFTAV